MCLNSSHSSEWHIGVTCLDVSVGKDKMVFILDNIDNVEWLYTNGEK